MSSFVWAHGSHPWGHPRPTLCRPWAQANELGETQPWETRARAGGVGVKRAQRARGLPLCGVAGAAPLPWAPARGALALPVGRRLSSLDTFEVSRLWRETCVRRCR